LYFRFAFQVINYWGSDIIIVGCGIIKARDSLKTEWEYPLAKGQGPTAKETSTACTIIICVKLQ
jgi:hypothetical protein